MNYEEAEKFIEDRVVWWTNENNRWRADPNYHRGQSLAYFKASESAYVAQELIYLLHRIFGTVVFGAYRDCPCPQCKAGWMDSTTFKGSLELPPGPLPPPQST
jgi:hypothetical protein